jgi:hypothetical protein
LARVAKQAGVARFLFSSSCSLYGAADGDAFLDELAAFNPVTPYGESKVLAERDIQGLADDDFSRWPTRPSPTRRRSPRRPARSSPVGFSPTARPSGGWRSGRPGTWACSTASRCPAAPRG